MDHFKDIDDIKEGRRIQNEVSLRLKYTSDTVIDSVTIENIQMEDASKH